MSLPRFNRPVSVVTIIALLMSLGIIHVLFSGTVSKCPRHDDVTQRLHDAVAALRQAAQSTMGTSAHADVTVALDRLLAVVGDVPTPVHETSVIRQRQVVDVCPEKYLGTVYDYPYHERNRPLQNCSNARPFPAVLSVLLNGFHYDSDDNIVKLLEEIAYTYPSLTVHIALPRKVQVSSTMNLDVHQHVLAKATPAGQVWNHLTKVATTDYVLVGRRLERFSLYARLERMVRLLSEHADVDFVGGAVRTPDGHWHMGCYQSAMRNYTLTYKDGYRTSLHSCAYCDYLMSPFVVRTAAARETQLTGALSSDVAFFDYFLRLAERKKTVMSCPDVMFYVTSEADAKVDELHTDWIPVVRERVLNRVVFPDGRGELNFSCKEAGTSCSYRAGVMLPICCVRNLLRVVRDVLAVCEKIGIYCQVDSGTAMGALKFNGILPWELDADILYIPDNRTSFWYHKDEFAKLGYTFKLQFPSQCHQFDQKNYRCIHFDVATEGFRLELFGDLPRSRSWQEFPKKEVLLPTKMLISGLWVNAPRNPGLTMNNRYGNEILKHVEHWMLYGRKSSWDLYNSGQFKPCPNPGMHYCLDRYSPDGSFEFQKP